MTAKKRDEAKKQTEMLAALRKQHSDQVNRLRPCSKNSKACARRFEEP